MNLSDVGVPGQQIDVLNGGDVDPSGRLLSVAQLQQEYRNELRRRSQAATRAPNETTAAERPHTAAERPHTSDGPGIAAPHTSANMAGDSPHTSNVVPRQDSTDSPHTSPRPTDTAGSPDRLGADWVAVVSAHSGAGASCVALAIADALSDANRPCRLIEAAHPARSGLVAAAAAELGTDSTGAWRRGSRRRSTLYRRASETSPNGWPVQADAAPMTTVVDLGLPAPANVARLVADRPSIVLVCRVTVPGLRLTEHLLGELAGAPVVLAALGPGRWPGEVVASLGPRVRALREARQVVTVPDDRHLQVTGPTNSPLPKSVTIAGRGLLGLIDAARPGGVGAPPNLTAQSAPRTKGTTR